MPKYYTVVSKQAESNIGWSEAWCKSTNIAENAIGYDVRHLPWVKGLQDEGPILGAHSCYLGTCLGDDDTEEDREVAAGEAEALSRFSRSGSKMIPIPTVLSPSREPHDPSAIH